MASIALSSGVRQALSSIQSTSSLQSVIQNRLATGKKVNSALDNPSSFFTASGLSNRAGDLTNLLDDMGQAVKTLEAADKAITSIGKLIDNAKSISKQAQAAPVDVAAKGGTVTASKTPTASDGTFKIAIGSASAVTVTIDDADNAAAIATKINTAAGAGTATVDSGGRLVLTADGASDHTKSITISEDTTDGATTTASRALLSGLGLTAGTTAATEASTKRADLSRDLAGIMTQIDDLAKDASYNGVNLVTGDNLKVAFNETGKSKLEITGKNLDSTGLNLGSLALDTNANIETSLASLKTATDTLRSQSATFGANLSVVQNRQDFTKGMIDTLNNGSDQLTLADPNEEGAKLLSLNTRAQLAGTALTLASQQDQAVLKLF
jgi:flagellin